jgi:hypothetical protein
MGGNVTSLQLYLRELGGVCKEASESRDPRVIVLTLKLLMRVPTNLRAMICRHLAGELSAGS